jgi:glycosyltransferase domain-containing protein
MGARTTADYTLVIPTYNRPALLSALLRFLAEHGADFPILILDSSTPQPRARNRAVIGRVNLDIRYVEYEETTLPFDKFRDGVDRIQTPLGSLCADDDLVLVRGLRACVEHLRQHPDVAVAHGYYFTFLDQGTPGISITAMLYFTPGIEDAEPLARLRSLLRQYQALTYAVYRTPILQSILARVRPVESLLARELLSGALAVVAGKVARLRCFYGGRSHHPSEKYRHWHPLEWLVTNAREFCEEYGRYRAILLPALRESHGNTFSAEDAERIVDLIHVFYLIAHAPRESHDFILDQVMAGRKLDEFWADPAIQHPLVREHYAQAPGPPAPAAGRRPGAALARLAARLRGRGESSAPASWPIVTRTAARTYRLHRRFYEFGASELAFATDRDVADLLASLDCYAPEPGDS